MDEKTSKNGGNLGESGCVNWMFEKKGTFTIFKKGIDEDELLDISLDLGAEDFNSDADDVFLIETSPDEFGNISRGLEDAGFDIQGEVGLVPINIVKVSGGDVSQLLSLLDLLENHEDIQKVYSNFDLDDGELDRLS